MVIKFTHIGCGLGGVLINGGWVYGVMVYVPGAVQEKLEPMRKAVKIMKKLASEMNSSREICQLNTGLTFSLMLSSPTPTHT
jgi:hypothetical protein